MRRSAAVWGLALGIAAACGEDPIETTRPPTAFAGFDAAIRVGAEVALDGSQSLDPDGDPLSFVWHFAAVPEGSLAQLTPADEPLTRFEPDRPGTYVVVLTVSDGAHEDRDLVGIEATVTSTTPEPLDVRLAPQSCNVAFDSPLTGACIEDGAVVVTPTDLEAPKTATSDLSLEWLFVRLPAGLAPADLSTSAVALGPLRFSPPRPGEYWVSTRLVGPRSVSAASLTAVRVHPPGTDLEALPEVRIEGPRTARVRERLLLDARSVVAPRPDVALQWSLQTDPSEGLTSLTDRNTGCPIDACRVLVPTAPGNYVVKLTGRTATGTAAPALFSIEVTP